MDGLWDCDDMFKLFVAILGRMKPSDIKNPFVSLQEHMLLCTNRQTRIKSHQTIDLHYNLGNDLYANMLDERMVYSCAYWKNVKDDQDLDQAQHNKLDLIARKLHLKPGMKVLDIGCGWGSAAKFMAEKYKVNVVGYSLSQEQIDYARESCKGLDNVEFHCEDYRNARGKFDRIFSIGFLEHVGVKNYRTYFEVVERCLEDDGIHLVHTITGRDHSMLKTEGFLDKYIFPNGEIPYVEEPLLHCDGLLMLEDLHNFGPSYTKTLLAWQKRFTKNWPKLENEFGPKAGGKFYRMWNYYLFVCAAIFETRLGNVCQYVQTKKGMRGGYDSVR
jgi:cyclopropane-fatty-acyl-phospholipid synthase